MPKIFSQAQSCAGDAMSPDFSGFLSNFTFSTTTAIDSVTSMQGIFELDGDCSVVLQGRIGQVCTVRTLVSLSHGLYCFHCFPSFYNFSSINPSSQYLNAA
jgi:hypothetical protein